MTYKDFTMTGKMGRRMTGTIGRTKTRTRTPESTFGGLINPLIGTLIQVEENRSPFGNRGAPTFDLY